MANPGRRTNCLFLSCVVLFFAIGTTTCVKEKNWSGLVDVPEPDVDGRGSETPCVPTCDGKTCGDDGCGGTCGECDGEQDACVEGLCVCEPACDGLGCGDDGCGGTCGDCECGEACQGGACVSTACDDLECGDDGCGETCGDCQDSPNWSCQAGKCVCFPDCFGKVKGALDGCGGCCGSCCIDGTCDEASGENCANCAEDCHCCPNGICDGWDENGDPLPGVQYLETHYSCKEDCTIPCVCGDGYCVCDETIDNCEPDCFGFADNICGPSENFQNSPFDCCGVCGDGKCQNYPGCNEGETAPGQWLCPEDCADFACGGDSGCQEGEDPINCPQDCEKFVCGNGVCEPTDGDDCGDCDNLVDCGDCVCQKPQEDAVNCPEDCGFCGDGLCSECAYPVDPETVDNCFADCSVCGDGICGPGESPLICPTDCCGLCGDGLCMAGELITCDEDADSCPADCAGFDCGDGTCEPAENRFSCPIDCPTGVCGNHVCEAENPPPPGQQPTGTGETGTSCQEDCPLWPICGDYLCQVPHETALTCPLDCGLCGDGICSASPLLGNEPVNCPVDCAGE